MTQAMKTPPTIGLLPLYLKLYDDVMPGSRAEFTGFAQGVKAAFEQRGISVVEADVCRVADEFSAAVRLFEDSRVDCIVIVHLSLESCKPIVARFVFA